MEGRSKPRAASRRMTRPSLSEGDSTADAGFGLHAMDIQPLSALGAVPHNGLAVRNDSVLNVLKASGSTACVVHVNDPINPLSNAEVIDLIAREIDRVVGAKHTLFIDIGRECLAMVMGVVSPYEMNRHGQPLMRICTGSANQSMSDAGFGTRQVVFDSNGHDVSYRGRPIKQLNCKVDVCDDGTRALAQETARTIRSRSSNDIPAEINGHVASRVA